MICRLRVLLIQKAGCGQNLGAKAESTNEFRQAVHLIQYVWSVQLDSEHCTLLAILVHVVVQTIFYFSGTCSSWQHAENKVTLRKT